MIHTADDIDLEVLPGDSYVLVLNPMLCCLVICRAQVFSQIERLLFRWENSFFFAVVLPDLLLRQTVGIAGRLVSGDSVP